MGDLSPMREILNLRMNLKYITKILRNVMSKTIRQKIKLDMTPHEAYEMLMDSKKLKNDSTSM